MFLETKRLILRKFQQEDFADFCEFAMDPDRNRAMGNGEVSSVDDARKLFNWLKDKEERAYAVVFKGTGQVVGNFTVYNELSDEIKTRPELAGKAGRSLSFSLSRAYRRQGLIFEAASAVITYLFEVEGVDYIHSGYLGSAPQPKSHWETSTLEQNMI